MSGPALGMSLQMRQQMVLAPQLLQSLEMLQLPVMELRALIQQEMERNPVLEDLRLRDLSIDAAREEERRRESGSNSGEDSRDGERREADATSDPEAELNFDRKLEALKHLDDDWHDYFYQDGGSQEYTQDLEEKRQFMFDSIVQHESFQEHLLLQLDLEEMGDEARKIAELLIGSLDESGYLTVPLAEIAQAAVTDLERLEAVLAVIQEMTPSGVGARDLRECLAIQLRHKQREESLAAKIVSEHLDLLAAHNLEQIATACQASLEEVRAAVREIGQLDPKPGISFSRETTVYVYPEMEVFLHEGRYVVKLDDTQLPTVRISRHYRRLLEDPATTPETRSYIRDRIRAGMTLIKSIHQRQDTIRRIATAIVDAQQEFFAHGIKRLRPMTMGEIASQVGVHETTVSRTVSNKYMRSPQGVLELRSFFTHGLKTADGAEISNRTVQETVAAIIAAEDPFKPLSDQDIQEQLQARGIDIARRTVAKYRINLKIPPSHRRRQKKQSGV